MKTTNRRVAFSLKEKPKGEFTKEISFDKLGWMTPKKSNGLASSIVCIELDPLTPHHNSGGLQTSLLLCSVQKHS